MKISLMFFLALNLNAATLKVEFSGNLKPGARIFCRLFESEKGFPDQESPGSLSQVVMVDKSEAPVCEFKDIKPGTYAVTAYEDANHDEKLNKNFLGIPQEKWGVTGKRPGFSAPLYQESVVKVDEDSKLAVRLK